jgi:FMN phosphatase YigB (HAD superfamily)
MFKDIQFVLFDWGGTLGKSGTRQQFIAASDGSAAKRKYLQKGTLRLLEHLHKKKIPMGILSNTSVSGKDMRRGIQKAGMNKYFKVQVYSSEPHIVCSKPCDDIFSYTLMEIQKKFPVHSAKNVLYVGDSYSADVWGAWNNGMKSAFLTNGSLTSIAVSSLLSLHDIAVDTLDELISMF